jgi:hypothetical protein
MKVWKFVACGLALLAAAFFDQDGRLSKLLERVPALAIRAIDAGLAVAAVVVVIATQLRRRRD